MMYKKIIGFHVIARSNSTLWIGHNAITKYRCVTFISAITKSRIS